MSTGQFILFLVIALVLWLLGIALTLFANEAVFRIIGVVFVAAAIPLTIAGGRGLRNRH